MLASVGRAASMNARTVAVARPAATILQSNRLLHSHMGQRSMRAPAFAVQAPSTEQGAYAQQAYARQPATDQETYFGTGYQVYKGSSAVQFKPICPSFTPHSGSANGYVLDRKGVMFLELATGSNRQYDWQNRVSFALSATEMSSLFLVNGALTADGGKGIQLYHDPNMGSNEQGQTRKVLRASLMQDGNISLSVQETQSGQSGKTVQVPMTPAEWMVCVEMAKFMIPRCLGLDKNW